MMKIMDNNYLFKRTLGTSIFFSRLFYKLLIYKVMLLLNIFPFLWLLFSLTFIFVTLRKFLFIILVFWFLRLENNFWIFIGPDVRFFIKDWLYIYLLLDQSSVLKKFSKLYGWIPRWRGQVQGCVILLQRAVTTETR